MALPCHLSLTPSSCVVRSSLCRQHILTQATLGLWTECDLVGVHCGRVVTEVLWRRITVVKMNLCWIVLKNHDTLLFILSSVPSEPRLPNFGPCSSEEALDFRYRWIRVLAGAGGAVGRIARDHAGGQVCCGTVKCPLLSSDQHGLHT